jgi:hypothetical protein
MFVILDNCGNPDFGQNPNHRIPGTEKRKHEVSSYDEASAVCMKYISEYDLGGGNWRGGQIYDNDVQVAHVSYNGRVWEGLNGNWKPGLKPLWEPQQIDF